MQPPIIVPDEHLDEDIQSLLQNQQFCDVIFVAQGVCIPAHKICLVSASSVFEELFLADWSEDGLLNMVELDKRLNENHQNGNSTGNGNHGSNGNSGHSSRSGSNSRSNSLKKTHSASKEKEKVGKVQSDKVNLLEFEEVETSSSVDASTSDINKAGVESGSVHRRILLNLPAFSSIEFEHVNDAFNPRETNIQTVVTLNDNISPASLQYVLKYLYTGKYFLLGGYTPFTESH